MASIKSVITIMNVGDNLDLGLAAVLDLLLFVIFCGTSLGSPHHNFGSLRLDYLYKNGKVTSRCLMVAV